MEQEGFVLQGLTPSQKPIPLALCQIVAHEVKLENIRRRHQVRVGLAYHASLCTHMAMPVPVDSLIQGQIMYLAMPHHGVSSFVIVTLCLLL